MNHILLPGTEYSRPLRKMSDTSETLLIPLLSSPLLHTGNSAPMGTDSLPAVARSSWGLPMLPPHTRLLAFPSETALASLQLHGLPRKREFSLTVPPSAI